MITEDYVSFETAKLLKEKGFDEDIARVVNEEGEIDYLGSFQPSLAYLHHTWYRCPTLQMAMKWLRNTFHLEIYPFHDAIQEFNDWWYRIEHHSKGCSLTKDESDSIYKTYEEACEAAIKYCLENLI